MRKARTLEALPSSNVHHQKTAFVIQQNGTSSLLYRRIVLLINRFDCDEITMELIECRTLGRAKHSNSPIPPITLSVELRATGLSGLSHSIRELTCNSVLHEFVARSTFSPKTETETDCPRSGRVSRTPMCPSEA